MRICEIIVAKVSIYKYLCYNQQKNKLLSQMARYMFLMETVVF